MLIKQCVSQTHITQCSQRAWWTEQMLLFILMRKARLKSCSHPYSWKAHVLRPATLKPEDYRADCPNLSCIRTVWKYKPVTCR